MVTIVSIIPARGGSKGVKNKNIKLLAGKPLIEYTIDASLKAKFISQTFVSSDSDEILKISHDKGAEIIERPIEYAEDDSTTECVIAHALDFLFKEKAMVPDIIVLLQPTSPLRSECDIEEAITYFLDKKFDSLLSVKEDHSFLWKYSDVKKCAEPVNYDFNFRPMRQNVSQYKENGAIYIFLTEGFKKYKNRLFGKVGIHVMPEERSMDIDSEVDFIMSEAILNKRETFK